MRGTDWVTGSQLPESEHTERWPRVGLWLHERSARVRVAAIFVIGFSLWLYVALRYQQLSAVPLDATRVAWRVGLLTLAHYLIGRSALWLLCGGRNVARDAWAWCILLGYGTAPAALWITDRFGARAAGWCALALLAAGGVALEFAHARDRIRARFGARPSGLAPRELRLSVRMLPPLVLLVWLATAAIVGLDHIVYLRPDANGVVLTLPEDNLVHAAFALEWARQQPYRHLWESFTPEHIGIAYHYLTDVQLAAWWSLCGGDHLAFIHNERFLLQGFALLIGLYLLGRAILESAPWALMTAGAFAALPYWLIGLDALPQQDGLERLWASFTFQNGAAFGGGLVASLWAWLYRHEPRFARIALMMALLLALAKVHFAVLAWGAACAVVLSVRPRAWKWWLSSLALLGAAIVALELRGSDILPMHPEWAPGRLWASLLTYSGDGARGGRMLCKFADWSSVGLAIFVLGTASAAFALRRLWPRSQAGRGLLVWVAASWAIALTCDSMFWLLDPHETAFQFLPWLSLVSIVAGIAGFRSAVNRLFSEHHAARLSLAVAGVALWGLVLTRAYVHTTGFTQCRWQTIPFSTESWATLEYLRNETPITARVLAPFESAHRKSGSAAYAVTSYAISGVAGRRAVDEHYSLAVSLPGLAERMVTRKRMVMRFYENPQPDSLEELAGAWQLDYVVLPSSQAARMPDALARAVFANSEWSVLQLRSR